MSNLTLPDNETNVDAISESSYSLKNPVTIITLGISIASFSLWSVIVLSRCNHVCVRNRIIYANLGMSDVIFGISVVINIFEMNRIPLGLCVCLRTVTGSSYMVFILTVCLICIDRIMTLWTMIPFISELSKSAVASCIVGIWSISLMIRGLSLLNSFEAYTVCSYKQNTDKNGSLALFIVLSALLSICFILLIWSFYLLKTHVMVVTNAPTLNQANTVQTYFSSAAKEITIILFITAFYIPISVKTFMDISKSKDGNEDDYRLITMILNVSVVSRILGTFCLCAVRFVEFRYKVLLSTCCFCRPIREWCNEQLEIQYPNIPSTNIEMREYSKEAAEENPGPYRRNKHISSSSVAPWEDIKIND